MKDHTNEQLVLLALDVSKINEKQLDQIKKMEIIFDQKLSILDETVLGKLEQIELACTMSTSEVKIAQDKMEGRFK